MKRIIKIIDGIFIAFLLYVILVKGIYLFDLVPAKVAYLCNAFIGVFAFLYIFKWHRKIARGRWTQTLNALPYKQVLVVLFVSSLMSKVVLTFTLQIASIESHPDIQVYVTTAKELAISGTVKKYADYCLTYSHMFWFSVFLSPIVKLFGDSQVTLSLYMMIVSTLSNLLIVDTVTFCTSKARGIVVGIFLCYLPSQLLINQYITHEHALLFFIALAMWLYFRVQPICSSRMIKAMCIINTALSLLAAFMVNAAGVVMIIAFVIMFIVDMFNSVSIKSVKRTLIKCLAFIVFVAIGSSICNDYQLEKSVVDDDYIKGDKVMWTLFVGANTATRGGWSLADAQAYESYSSDSTDEQIKEFRKGLLLGRYQELFRHPIELILHLKNKSVTIWHGFTYPISYSNETIKNEQFQRFYNRFCFKLLVLLEWGLTLLASVEGLSSMVRKIKDSEYNRMWLITELFLMGATAMLLLTECNNKYTLAMQPFFWITSVTAKK